MRKRGLLWSVTAVALAVAVSAAMPAFGAPSPLSIAKRALGIAKKADKRSKRALRLALRVPAKGPKGDRPAAQASVVGAGGRANGQEPLDVGNQYSQLFAGHGLSGADPFVCALLTAFTSYGGQ